MLRPILIFSVLMLIFGESHAQTGSIEVEVELAASRIGQSGARSQSRYRRPADAPADAPASAQPVLVWVEGSTPVNHNQGTPPLLNQQNIQFEPRLVAVIQGQKVRVINSDPVFHNVFSLSSVKRFDIGRRPTGEYVDVQFEEAGVVQVFCDIHPHMSATIHVLPPTTVTWTISSEPGVVRLDGIPPGSYRVHIVAPGYLEWSRTLTIPAGETLQVGRIRLEAS